MFLGQSLSSNNVASEQAATLPPKKKFGGSLRRLFHMRKRSSSASRAANRRKNILNDLDKPISSDRLSIEGDRPSPHGSRSSFEKDPTPPHHRTLSPSSSNYSYGSQNHNPEPRQNRIDAMMTSSQPNYPDDGDGMYSGLIEDRRHYSMPSQKRPPPRRLL